MGSLTRGIIRNACLALLVGTTACTGIRRQLYVDYAEPARRLRSPVSLNIASEQAKEVPNEIQFELAVSPPRDSAILIVFRPSLLTSDPLLDGVLDPAARADLTRFLTDSGAINVVPRVIEVRAEHGDLQVLDSLALLRATLRPPLTFARSVGADRGTTLPVEGGEQWCIIGPEIRARFVLHGKLRPDREVRDERYTTSVRWISLPAPVNVATRCHPSEARYDPAPFGLVGTAPLSLRSGARVDSLTASARMVRYSFLTIAGLGFILVTGIFTVAGS